MLRVLRPAAGPLRGTVEVPGDKSVSHRVALFAPLATGPCRARGWLEADDTRRSLAAVKSLGARVEGGGGALTISAGGFPGIVGKGDGRPGPRSLASIDCGNSGTTARLLMGLLAGRSVTAILDGDASLRGRPMERVAGPLTALGARIEWIDRPNRLPARVTGQPLRGGTVRLPVVSAQVKSAVLLAGLAASGPVTLANCGATRDHTERLLRLMRANVRAAPGKDELTVMPAETLRPFDVEVPGDPSSAAFLLAAALLVPQSEVTVGNLLLGPTRTGFLRVLQKMGAPLFVEASPLGGWEPTGTVTVGHGPLRAFTIEPAEVPSLIDELPILAVLATRAVGLSTVSGAAELRVKESDRIAVLAAGLRALGVPVEERPDGFAIRGPCALRPPVASCADDPGAVLATAGDHRLAMAFAVASLAAEGEVRLDDDASMAISFPGFLSTLESLQPRG